MTEVIGRQETVDELELHKCSDEDFDDAIDYCIAVISTMPSTGGWIPVFSDPPKAPCIVTDAQGHVYGTRGLYTWIEGEKTVSVAIEIIMSESLVYYGGAGDYDRLKDYIIVAWMPFPAPYKEEQGHDD